MGGGVNVLSFVGFFSEVVREFTEKKYMFGIGHLRILSIH